jgi:hypothetical protein
MVSMNETVPWIKRNTILGKIHNCTFVHAQKAHNSII